MVRIARSVCFPAVEPAVAVVRGGRVVAAVSRQMTTDEDIDCSKDEPLWWGNREELEANQTRGGGLVDSDEVSTALCVDLQHRRRLDAPRCRRRGVYGGVLGDPSRFAGPFPGSSPSRRFRRRHRGATRLTWFEQHASRVLGDPRSGLCPEPRPQPGRGSQKTPYKN